MAKKAIFNWSGGKDSSLALHKVLQGSEYDVVGLLTTINKKHKRISMHGVREELLDKQAEEIGLPLYKVYLPENLKMEAYDRLITDQLEALKKQGVTHSIFGDIFLEDLREYRERQLETIGLQGVFPLWKQETGTLANEFISLGFKAVLTAIDASKLDKSFALSEFDHTLLKRLPDSVDVCGENGEFHSYVYEGPIFKKSIPIKRGEIITESYKDEGHSFDFFFGDLQMNEGV